MLLAGGWLKAGPAASNEAEVAPKKDRLFKKLRFTDCLLRIGLSFPVAFGQMNAGGDAGSFYEPIDNPRCGAHRRRDFFPGAIRVLTKRLRDLPVCQTTYCVDGYG